MSNWYLCSNHCFNTGKEFPYTLAPPVHRMQVVPVNCEGRMFVCEQSKAS